uniref:Epidermal patterning factor-like protein n=1 Tax=Nicotiana tabacum TaxID=4097 RepID=A0A1S3XZ94_TOBAC|nr:EPIDERMAL PATTERNING FACTOR-like protein 8 isoform X2 [Nicotiana tomentosiformis]XP_016445266.1 PREDICTED: EPIDERMAL PATTERNING FACTOR-like protein 8 [Nicotiana tabacum]
MASTTNMSNSKGLKFAVILMFIYSLTFLPSISGRSGERKQMRMVMLGSSPPKCVNRCKGCRPCMAVLVIPPHITSSGKVSKALNTLYTREDEGYYLLSWKCKCGTKYFQP